MPMTATATGLVELQKRMKGLHADIQKPDLSYSVRGMARVWEANFQSEGAAVGGWEDLSEFTNKKRIERGYPPEHPILEQTGALRKTVITALLASRQGRSVSSPGINMTSVYHGLRATLTATGEKAQNQTGGKGSTKRSSPIPARPFWFVDANVQNAAAEGLQRSITKILKAYQ